MLSAESFKMGWYSAGTRSLCPAWALDLLVRQTLPSLAVGETQLH